MRSLLTSLTLIAFFVASCSSDSTTTTTEANDTVLTQEISEQHRISESESTSTTQTEEQTEATEIESNNTEKAPAKVVSNTKTSRSSSSTTTQNTTQQSSQSSSTTTTQTTSNNRPKHPPRYPPVPPQKPPLPPLPSSKTSQPSSSKKIAFSHDIFDGLLRKYVNSSGGVDYKGLQKNSATLDNYLKLLAANPPQSSWSKNKQMAFWINLYNAFTIQTILSQYPVGSIMDIDGGKVWDSRKVKIGSKSYTLNDIEKKMLLQKFKEPRVHFAVNCAAASCPPLLNKAWTESNIQRYYASRTKAFINNKNYNIVRAKKITASNIFNWYANDFGGSDKIVAFFQKYSETTIKKNAKVTFSDYNWKLNKK